MKRYILIMAFLFAATSASAQMLTTPESMKTPGSMRTPRSDVTVPGKESLYPQTSPAPAVVAEPTPEPAQEQGIVRSNEVPASSEINSSPAATVAANVASAPADIQSLIPLANQYNSYCGLGLSPITIQLLAAQAESMRSSGQLTDAVITKNVNMAKQQYAQNPSAFCQQAQQVANMVRNMYPITQGQ